MSVEAEVQWVCRRCFGVERSGSSVEARDGAVGLRCCSHGVEAGADIGRVRRLAMPDGQMIEMAPEELLVAAQIPSR